MSPFDDDAFNDRLFFPRRDRSVCASADDVFVGVDGAQLHLRVHRPRPSASAMVLLFHGNGEVVADYDDVAGSYEDAGAALAVVDFRGYGQSTGVPTLRDLLEDSASVVAAAARAADAAGLALVVMGRSLGSLCAAEVCGNPSLTSVSAIIIESGIGDLAGLLERRNLDAPAEFSDEDRADFDPLLRLRRGQRPLLVLHGEEDEIIDVAEGEALFAASPADNKTMIRVKNRGHNDISMSRDYWSAIRLFCGRLVPDRG